jgi:undecaprenyl-diphosphatase
MIDLSHLLGPLLLGIVEGLTEFIPVSSTGHLILTQRLVGYDGPAADVLEVVIQAGAILAICWIYRMRIWGVITTLPSDPASRRFCANILIAFLPAAFVGALAHDFIKRELFSPTVVAVSLILGGLAILLVERYLARRPHACAMDQVSPRLALGVGIFQLLAMVPGVSRSGATIMGALALGMDRKTAAEFSFFLAIPTMFGAAAYDLYKSPAPLTGDSLAAISVGLVASFGVALTVVSWLIGFVARHGFTAFAWYRIVAGVAVLAALYG